MNKYTSAVEKGIKFLNKIAPDWRKKIEVESLDLGNCKACILGQLFGDYWDAFEDYLDSNEVMSLELGFKISLYDYFYDYELLTEAWKLALDKIGA